MTLHVTRRGGLFGLASLAAGLPAIAASGAPGDPLPSWSDGESKRRILAFVAGATQPGAAFVPPPERIATFDNDGTLWCEQPIYTEFVFAIDRARRLAMQNPALAQQAAFKAVLSGDPAAIATLAEQDLVALLVASHSNVTTDAFVAAARDWLATARHPRFARRYAELVYQPQLELLAYLRTNGFKTFVVSGGGVDFMRAFAEAAYGVPPEQVIGSSGKTRFDLSGDRASLMKLPEIGSVDDAEGKPQNIELHIGRRPVIAVGNSDGDLAMLQYAASGERPSLEILVHHDDAVREYAYDRGSKVGALDKAWDEAIRRHWLVVGMARDWRAVFPAQPPGAAA